MSERHKSPLPFIKDIMDSIEKVEKYCQNITYDQFLQDDKTKDAVVRNLEIIGKAAKNIPDYIKKMYSETAWKSMTGMRDKLIHEYFGVSYSTVWETAKGDLPMLKESVRELYDTIKPKNDTGLPS
jgi:uncharacterized protein with HEPN domain